MLITLTYLKRFQRKNSDLISQVLKSEKDRSWMNQAKNYYPNTLLTIFFHLLWVWDWSSSSFLDSLCFFFFDLFFDFLCLSPLCFLLLSFFSCFSFHFFGLWELLIFNSDLFLLSSTFTFDTESNSTNRNSAFALFKLYFSVYFLGSCSFFWLSSNMSSKSWIAFCYVLFSYHSTSKFSLSSPKVISLSSIFYLIFYFHLTWENSGYFSLEQEFAFRIFAAYSEFWIWKVLISFSHQ